MTGCGQGRTRGRGLSALGVRQRGVFTNKSKDFGQNSTDGKARPLQHRGGFEVRIGPATAPPRGLGKVVGAGKPPVSKLFGVDAFCGVLVELGRAGQIASRLWP